MFEVDILAYVADPALTFESVELALMRRGFWRDRAVFVSDIDGNEEEKLLIDSLAHDRETLRLWPVIYMEFSEPKIGTIGLQVERSTAGFATCQVSLYERTVLVLHKDGIPQNLYSSLGDLASVMGLDFGIGGVARSSEDVDLAMVWRTLQTDPSESSVWDSVVIVPTPAVTPEQDYAWRSSFTRLEVGGYTFFISHDLLEAARVSR